MALINSLDSGVSALKSFTEGMNVIGNNIANINTNGFKASNARFAESLNNTFQASGAVAGDSAGTSIVQVGTGVSVSDVSGDFSQGNLTATDIPTDLAINGDGFFLVRNSLTDETYATRAGNFRLDDRGYIVFDQGLRMQGLSDGSISYDVTEVNGQAVFSPTSTAPSTYGDLQINTTLSTGTNVTNSTGGAFTDQEIDDMVPRLDGFSIDGRGQVHAIMSNGDTFVRGQIMLTDFSDKQALTREGGGLFSNFQAAGVVNDGTVTATTNTPGNGSMGSILSGKLELSNVELTDEFSNLITIQRSFQAGARIVTTSDEILQEVVNLKR